MKHINKNIYSIGSLRIYNIINPPNEPTYYPAKNIQHAHTLINSLAISQLLDSNIDSNVFGLEIMDKDGEWMEWESEDGYTIQDIKDIKEMEEIKI